MSRPIADVLRDLAAGQTYEAINTRLAEVVDAVMETGKVGELTIRLKFKPNGESSIIVTDEIKSKAPERTRGETLFFTTTGGGLMRQDPRQPDLPLRVVPDAQSVKGSA